MFKRNNEIFNAELLNELEARVVKLTERSETALPNEMNHFDQVTEQFNARLDELCGKDSHSDDEVHKLLAQIKSEIKLEAKSAELSHKTDQELRNRLERLKADRRHKTSATELSDISNNTSNGVRKKIPVRFSFDDTQSIITANLGAQAGIADTFADQLDNIQDQKSLTTLANKLKEMSNIIDDIPPIPKEYEAQVSTIITNGLQKIYEGIKAVVSPAIDVLKEIGSTFMNSIKSFFQESPEKQIAVTKANLNGLYKTYAEVKGADDKVKEAFLKNHYEQIDQLHSPQELLAENIKITKSIIYARINKMKDRKQQQLIGKIRKRQRYNATTDSNSLTPPRTPNNVRLSSIRQH